MKKSWIAVLLLAAGLATQGAHAVPTILTFDLTTGSPDLANNPCQNGTSLVASQGCLENGDKVTATNVDGTVTMTFSAVNPASAQPYIRVDNDGIYFDECGTLGSCSGIQQDAAGSFGISFDREVSIQEYTVNWVASGNSSFSGGLQIFSDAAFTTALMNVNPMGTTGTFTISNPWSFTANTVYYVKGNTNRLATLSALGFFIEDTNGVPEPATLALFGLGLAGIGAVRRRKLAA